MFLYRKEHLNFLELGKSVYNNFGVYQPSAVFFCKNIYDDSQTDTTGLAL
jgi:hypothetical protein